MNIRLWRSAATCLAAVLTLNGLSATSASGADRTGTNVLSTGQTLTAGQRLTSLNGSYSAVMQRDGRFAVYGPHGRGWATKPSSANRIVMQADGNLVAYNPTNKVTYTSRTPSPFSDELVMRSDGNLVIVSGDCTLWTNGVVSPLVCNYD